MQLKPILLLFFLSPMVGELLSGSSPPLSFFTPFGLFFLTGLYGSGAIIVREVSTRWGKGWGSVLLLGAAYGVLEEGVMVKSFFDPHWQDLGILGTYGRWAGMNWVWTQWLIIFHSIYSITIPIFIVSVIFPQLKGISYIGKVGGAFFAILLAFVVAIGHFIMTPFETTALENVGSVIAIAALGILAYRSRPLKLGGMGTATRPRTLFLLGLVAGFGYVLIFDSLPFTGMPPLLTMAVGVLWTALFCLLVTRLGKGGLALSHGVALAGGLLGWLIFFGPIEEMRSFSSKNPAGEVVVDVGFMLFLWWLARRARSTDERARATKLGTTDEPLRLLPST